jgi:hypothetical protein
MLHSVARPAVHTFAGDVEAKLAVRVYLRVFVAGQAYPRVHAERWPINVICVVGFGLRDGSFVRERHYFSGHRELPKI